MNPDQRAKVTKTDEEWRKQLTPEQYHVTRQHGTERAFSNPLNNEKRAGMFNCVCCGAPLFCLRHQVRVRHRLAELLGTGQQGRGERARRPLVVHAPHRGSLRDVRRASRPRLSRRPEADRRALLHERRRAEVCPRDWEDVKLGETEDGARERSRNAIVGSALAPA